MVGGREEIEKLQLTRLRTLLGELRKGNRFYGEKLAEAELDENIADLSAFTSRMPFTTKMDLVWDREEHPPYGSNLTYPQEEYSRYNQSSGTMSSPLAFIDTPESWSAMLDCWDRVYENAGVEKSDVIFFAFSFGPFLGFWTAFEAATRRGNLSIPGGGFSSAARLETMRANRASVLCCTPTYAIRLGEVLRGEGTTGDPPVRRIIVAGEPGGCIPQTRKLIENLWEGARVVDHHGMTEVGPVSFEHPDRRMSLCIVEEAYLAEIIDKESQEEVEEGETGELVLTTLTRTASPLLRYRTGDLVRKGYFREPGSEAASCGLILEGGILGRLDEMVVIRGVNVYPTAIEKIIRGFSDVAEYQVVQSTRNAMAELEIAVEPGEGVRDGKALAKEVERGLSKAFALRIPVSVAGRGSLPRYEFKSERWIRK